MPDLKASPNCLLPFTEGLVVMVDVSVVVVLTGDALAPFTLVTLLLLLVVDVVLIILLLLLVLLLVE